MKTTLVSAPKTPSRVSQSRSDPLRLFIPQHSKSFDFTPFVGLGKTFVIALGRVFATRAGSLTQNSACRDYYALKKLLVWIQENIRAFPTFRHKLYTDYRSIEVEEWELVLSTWRDELVHHAQHPSETTRAGLIRTINTLLGYLESARVIKPIFRLIPIKNASRKGTPKKCLGEVSTEFRYPLAEHVHNGSGQVDDISRGEICGITEQYGLSHPAESIAQLNEKRLDDLRKCAEKDLTYWISHFEEGQRLLRACDMKFSEIREQLHTSQHNRGARRWILGKLFPRNSRDVTLSRYLTYILNEHGGVIPDDRSVQYFVSRLCRTRRLKRDELQAYLIPHPQATTAVQIIFLIDTGANISVCHSLDRKCLSNSEVKRHKRIAGFKDRAGGKLIVSELPISDPRYRISCVQALESYLKMSKLLSECATSEVRNRLFLHVFRKGKRGIRPFNPYVANEQFPAFLARHKELAGLKLRLDMIRPTVLFQMIHKNNGNLVFANALANHSSLTTTSHYANRFSLHLVYNALTREFQSIFQAVSVSQINGAAQKLNINDSEFHRLLKNAHRTGLGVACLNPKSGYQSESVKGKDCVSLQNCPRCPLQFVVATVSNLTDLILFHRHLQTSRMEFEATRPTRWLEVWLPWFVFSEVALEKAQRGRTAATYLEARKRADARIASGTVNFPPLW